MIRPAFVLWLLAGPVVAQTAPDAARMIPVLSGEHAGFTRLSLQIGSRQWQIGRTARGYGLWLSPRGVLETGRIFTTITRDRIADVVQTPSGLEVVLDCVCHLRSFRHQNDWLVMDIVAGPPSPDSPYERPLPDDGGALPVILLQDAQFLPSVLRQPVVPDLAIDAFETGLRQQIADAARRDDVSPVTPLDTPMPADPLGLVMPDALPPAPQPAINLHYDAFVEEGMLRDAWPASACAGDSAFAVHEWAGETFATRIAATQSALGQAADPALVAVEMAQAYVAYGFGLEAKQVLASYAVTPDQAGFLPVLADIVDGRPVEAAFALQEGCTGAVSLWRALGTQSLRHASGEEMSAILSTFRTLPNDLRLQLAPRIANLFAAEGHANLAYDIMEADPTAPLAPAATTARDPDLVIAATDKALAQGQGVTEDDLQLLQSLRYEWRGTPAEPALQAAETRVLSALGQHAQAMATAAALPDDVRDHPLAAAVDSFIRTAPSDSFLSAALTLPPQLSPPLINQVAKRLIDEGFADLALRFLAPSATGPDMAERRYLRAEAAAGLGLAEMVEAELLGLTDARAEGLRAAVLATTPDQDSYAWRRADLPALQSSDDALLQQVAQAVEGEPPPLPATPLASREALIARAQEARALANALLARFSARP